MMERELKMTDKICISCKINKPLSEFHKSKTNKDKHHKQCKICRSTKKPLPFIKAGMKLCSRCKIEKELSYFSKTTGIKSGLASWCKECSSIVAKNKRKPITEARLEAKARFNSTEGYRTCTKCDIEQPIANFRRCGGSKNSRRSDCKTCTDKINKPARRERHLQKFYGLSVKDYEDMVLSQNNLCAICGSSEPHVGASLAVDHNHTTGKVRELLCSHCNLLLGHAKDSVDILKVAIQYLIKHN